MPRYDHVIGATRLRMAGHDTNQVRVSRQRRRACALVRALLRSASGAVLTWKRAVVALATCTELDVPAFEMLRRELQLGRLHSSALNSVHRTTGIDFTGMRVSTDPYWIEFFVAMETLRRAFAITRTDGDMCA